jgi:hypothetical protein
MQQWVWAGFLLVCAAMVAMTGLVWGGPWPPKAAITDGRAEHARLGGLRITTAAWLVVVVGLVWRVDVLDNVAGRYGCFVLAPLILGVIVRRVLLRRERRADAA